MKRVISILLVIVLSISLIGCKAKDLPREGEKIDIPTTGKLENDKANGQVQLDTSDGMSLLKSLKATYSSSISSGSKDITYRKPLYSVSDTEAFEFEASEEAGYNAYKAFKVFKNAEDIDNPLAQSFCSIEYDNGRLVVSANGAIELNGTSMSNAPNGNWGSYNKMYLVQYINLNTGVELVKPYVTPFTVEHELDAPVVTQGVTESNIYELRWQPVKGASEYRIYRHYGTNNFELEATTSDTSITSDEFERQQRKDNYTDLINKDLGLVGSAKVTPLMNSGVKPIESDDTDGRYVVIAVDSSGRQSGISNIVNIRDIGNKLPYQINAVDSTIVLNIENVEELPTYVSVEMIDGSYSDMIINYHGSQATEFEDKIWIQPTVVNTSFSPFILEIHGIDYDEMMANISKVTARQDSLVVTKPDTTDQVVIQEAPSIDRDEENKETKQLIDNTVQEVEEQEEDKIEELLVETDEIQEPINDTKEDTDSENNNSGDTSEVITSGKDNELVVTPEGYTTVDLLVEVSGEVQNRLSTLDSSIEEALFARNDLQAWIAACLVTNMEVIPVPMVVYPDAVNQEYLVSLLVEAYRQNPTSGMIADIGYNYDYESLVIKYVENWETRLERANKELASAKKIASQLLSQSNTEYEKILAINNYICDNATYDMDSAATDVDLMNVSQQFIDAHTPYGIICNNYGVCESYAESMLLIGRMMGLDVRCVMGTLFGGGHEWNKVKIGDNWYIIDITNNDNESISNAFLNVTDMQSNATLAEDKACNLDNLEAFDDQHEYYKVNGLAVSDKSEAARIIVDGFNAGKDKVSMRIPVGFTEEDCIEIVREAYMELGSNFYIGMLNGVLVASKTQLQ